MAKTRILLADDHEIVRQGLRSLLENDGFEICGEFSNGREAVDGVKQLKPDVAILDISMPELNGVEATQQIARQFPDSRVIVMTMHDSEELARRVLEAGARGYVLKSDAARDLTQAVKSVLKGQPFFSGKISEMLLRGYLDGGRSAQPESSLPSLTPREREVVQLLAEGKSSKEVASVLGTSPATVETQRAKIMQKLDLHSVTDLVRYAIRNHIIEP
ncbi:MAG TPA: response regulator transcription factor [Terriglobales bacterium]|jgi:DNA-binding NarL/FixJ family response regulator|nr:response regulator transcription factor [Terriglobales bacterium]